METDRIKQFCTVAEVGVLRKAADLLHMTPSALSKSLKTLQVNLGMNLFELKGRGMILNESGKAFLPKAYKLLKFVEDVTENTKPESEENYFLKIGTFEVFSTYFFANLVAPEFDRIEIREYLPGELERGLIDGAVDVGITYDPVPTQSIDILKICETKMGLFTGPTFVEKEFDKMPFIVPAQSLDLHLSKVKGLDGWPVGVDRHVQYRVDLFQTALELCSLGHGAIFAPIFVVSLFNQRVKEGFQLYQKPLPFTAESREIFLLKRDSSPESTEIKKICRILRSIVQLEKE